MIFNLLMPASLSGGGGREEPEPEPSEITLEGLIESRIDFINTLHEKWELDHVENTVDSNWIEIFERSVGLLVGGKVYHSEFEVDGSNENAAAIVTNAAADIEGITDEMGLMISFTDITNRSNPGHVTIQGTINRVENSFCTTGVDSNRLRLYQEIEESGDSEWMMDVLYANAQEIISVLSEFRWDCGCHGIYNDNPNTNQAGAAR